MKVIREAKNKMLKRKELVVKEFYDSNPGFSGATKLISEKFGANDDVIVIKKINGSFGTREFLIEAYIYESGADKERAEPKAKEKK